MKTCFKCNTLKPLSEFYPHPQMADGHLNKCKECNKKDSSARIAKMKQDPKWVMKERERCRLKITADRINGTSRQTSNEAKRRWEERNQHKKAAERIAYQAKKRGELKPARACERCKLRGLHLVMHHPDYSQPKLVLWLCTSCHGFVHRKPEPVTCLFDL